MTSGFPDEPPDVPVFSPEVSRLAFTFTGIVIETELIMLRTVAIAEDTAEVIPDVFTFNFGRIFSALLR